jgi:hypothetical protein
MKSPTIHKLIIVEGLTGSGKSIMAHYIARQLGHNGVNAAWIHEGESPHPILIDVGSSIEGYMADTLVNWQAFVCHIKGSGQVIVVEACLFNNLIESLLAHNVARKRIIQYADLLWEIIEPLDPALVYLTQKDVARAFERNFSDRGNGFKGYVVRYATGTPFAKQSGFSGYDGMLAFWREFVALTDELFHRYGGQKLMIDNSARDWHSYNRQVLDFLSIPLVPEPDLPQSEALSFVGTYRDEHSGRQFTVQYEDGVLSVDLFLNVRTRLIPKAEGILLTEGWHFEVSFEKDVSGDVGTLSIGGRDVDYLSLVGTVAQTGLAV